MIRMSTIPSIVKREPYRLLASMWPRLGATRLCGSHCVVRSDSQRPIVDLPRAASERSLARKPLSNRLVVGCWTRWGVGSESGSWGVG